MAKRKKDEYEEGHRRISGAASDDDSDSASARSLVNIDFEFFDPNPSVDYQAFKRLFTQLFGSDAHFFPIHDLVDLVLGQPLVGTTVKTDGLDSDPLAVLSVLNVHVHKDRPSIQALITYDLEKSEAAPDKSFHCALQAILAQDGQTLGLVISERLINMPVQVIPPMYRMLANEIQWALDDNEPYRFTHFLFTSRTYSLSAEDEEKLANTTSSKRQKRRAHEQENKAPPSLGGLYPFHPEDVCIAKFSTHVLDFPLTTAPPSEREKDAFGLDVRGRLTLVPATRLEELVHALAADFGVQGTGLSER